MLWLLISKNQVNAVVSKAPTNTIVHNGPGRPVRTPCKRLPRNWANHVKPSVALRVNRFLALSRRLQLSEMRLKFAQCDTFLLWDDTSPLLGPGNINYL